MTRRGLLLLLLLVAVDYQEYDNEYYERSRDHVSDHQAYLLDGTFTIRMLHPIRRPELTLLPLGASPARSTLAASFSPPPTGRHSERSRGGERTEEGETETVPRATANSRPGKGRDVILLQRHARQTLRRFRHEPGVTRKRG